MQNIDIENVISVLSDDEKNHLKHAENVIKKAIVENNGKIPFDQFMNMALYEPGVGYYVSGTQKFGAGGDFITAPEISPLFSQCLAQQCAQVLDELKQENIQSDILEFGAGSGTMASHILLELNNTDNLPKNYLILEPSPELQNRQKQTIEKNAPQLLNLVSWLDRLPTNFNGIMIGNEILDAMPVSRFKKEDTGLEEMFITLDEGKLTETWFKSDNTALIKVVAEIEKNHDEFKPGYESEINPQIQSWLKAIDKSLNKGAIILIDYGYEESAYYHQDRYMGTLICHFRHQAHDNTTILCGLQDLTANVNFTEIARSSVDTNLSLSGYTTQTHFLMSCGLEHYIGAYDPEHEKSYIPMIQGVKKLTLPNEMGERFKVIGLSKNIKGDLVGFSLRDLSAIL